jgi:ribosomal protein L32
VSFWADRVFTNLFQIRSHHGRSAKQKVPLQARHAPLAQCIVRGIAVEPTTGETHLRHHISPNGFYRGRQVLKNKSEA